MPAEMNRSEELDRLRLLGEWQPGAWIGAVRKAFGPMAELAEDSDEDTFEHRPAQWLIVLWPPQSLREPFLRRWPAMVQLTANEGAAAEQQLLDQVPPESRLWVHGFDVDWALMAEIVLLTEEDLQPWQHRELARFIVEQRQATAEAIAAHYVGQDDDDFVPTQPSLDG
jgi:hypothetical protein